MKHWYAPSLNLLLSCIPFSRWQLFSGCLGPKPWSHPWFLFPSQPSCNAFINPTAMSSGYIWNLTTSYQLPCWILFTPFTSFLKFPFSVKSLLAILFEIVPLTFCPLFCTNSSFSSCDYKYHAYYSCMLCVSLCASHTIYTWLAWHYFYSGISGLLAFLLFHCLGFLQDP